MVDRIAKQKEYEKQLINLTVDVAEKKLGLDKIKEELESLRLWAKPKDDNPNSITLTNEHWSSELKSYVNGRNAIYMFTAVANSTANVMIGIDGLPKYPLKRKGGENVNDILNTQTYFIRFVYTPNLPYWELIEFWQKDEEVTQEEVDEAAGLQP